MANNARKEFKEGFLWMWQNVARWVTNLLVWKPWGENNTSTKALLFWWNENKNPTQADSIAVPSVSNIQKIPTLNDVATWNTSWWVQIPDLTMPDNSLWVDVSQWQEDADVDDVLSSQKAQTSSWLTARDIIEWAWVKNTVDVLTEEEKIKNEDWKWTLDSAAKSVYNFFTKTINPYHWGQKTWEWALKESDYQAWEDAVAVGYNPENWNIMQLAINEWQWYTDDFWDTFWRRNRWNNKVFARLYNEYNNVLRWINYSNLDDEAKSKLFYEAFKSFKDDVEGRELIKVYENDLYSDWLFAPIFSDATRIWRMKDKFSQEELDDLSKSNIKKWWIYKLSDEQFQAFLDSYDRNNELAREIWSSDEEDWQSFIAWLEDESRWEAMAAQQHMVLDWVTQQLTAQMEAGRITPAQRNAIENRIMSVVDERLDTMWLYLDWPLSFYTLVKQKDYWDLTDWEKTILLYGPWIINFMEDYTNALSRWAEETVRTWINDEGELAKIPDTIDWMSVNDYFNNAVRNSNIQAGWIDLLATESAVDAMQLINQNINHLYWEDKWNWLRRDWAEAWYRAWSYWYTAMELWQMWLNYIIWWAISQNLWLDLPNWADRAQDYHRADWLTASLAETDEEWHWYTLWSSDLSRLLKEYGLELTDIAWETAGILLAEKPFLWRVWGAAKKSYQWINATTRWLRKSVWIQREANAIARLYNNAKSSVWNTKIVWWTRRYLNSVIDNISPQANARTRAILELSKNWLKRIANDQIIDATSTYLDTESFSTPSFWLSIWLTSATELLPALLKDAQLGRIISNKIGWVWALDNTGWKILDVMTTDENVMKAFGRYFGTTSPTFQQLKTLSNQWWWNFEDVLKQMYNQLNPDAKIAMNKFSKEVIAEQISRLTNLDWNSTYGKNLRALIDANWTNIADVWKYIFNIPGKVDVWWFSSSILFKEWADLQTRYLTKNYPVVLDNIDWGFRNKLQNWFTRVDIEQIAGETPYKSVIKNWKVNDEWFEMIEDWKYALNWEWAKALWLDVSEYTEAMAKADVIRKEAEWTKEFLDESLQKLAEWRWISKATINKVVDSWAFNRMINEFEKIVC